MPVLLLSMGSKVLAQAEYKKGYLVTLSNDTISGYIQEKSSFEYTKKTKFIFKDEQGKKRKFKVNKIKAYYIDNDWYEGIWVLESTVRLVNSYTTKDGYGERKFLKVIERGELIHYQEELEDQGSQFIQSVDFIKRPQEDRMVRATQGLLGLKRKRLIEYFQDCPSLRSQIENKQVNTVAEILDFHSLNCQ